MGTAFNYVDKHRVQLIHQLEDCLRIPSISVSETHKNDVARCAAFLKNHVTRIGLENARVIETEKHPVLYADWLNAPGRPTILVYGHYDVQPVDPISQWINPPFEPQVRTGDLYARGSVDDKGQVYIHLSAIEAILKTQGRLPVNLKLFIEGEEEIGSPSLASFLKKYRNLLNADAVLISDTPMLDKGIPSICYGLRGLCYMEIEVTGPVQDLHSGVWGGAIDNPARALTEVLSTLKDQCGRVLIPHFYEDVRPISAVERKMLKALPVSEKKLLKFTGASGWYGEKGYSILERIWTRPTLDINGLFGGFSGPGSKTIIPARAGAKVSMRLVPDQDPKKIAKAFKAHVRKMAPVSVKIRVIEHHGSPAFLEDFRQPIFRVAESALEKAFGKKAYFIREGGTIPFVKTISDRLRKPCVLLGFGLPDENAHAPNERLHLNNFFLGIKSMIHFYEQLAEMSARQ